jgi:hypothetical protein
MTATERRELAQIEAPYGRRVRLDELVHESGMKMLRVTIREGSRFTILEIDAPTAALWGDAMRQWSDEAAENTTEGEK